MKDKKIKLFFLFATFSLVTFLLLVSRFVSTSEVNHASGFMLQHIEQKETLTLETTNEINSIQQSFADTNISPAIVSVENYEKNFEVEYYVAESTPESTIYRKDIFVEMEDIKNSANNIFFVETKCATNKSAQKFNDIKGFVLNARQICAIESTGLMNPDHQLYIFYSCPLEDDFVNHSPTYVERLLRNPNIHIVRMNTTEVLMGTPLQTFGEKRMLETSAYPIEHASDLIRLVLLWKFGGTYSDLDVVTQRSFDGLGTNWVGMQDIWTIANGVLNFQLGTEGSGILQKALEHISKHYEGTGWSSNGPELITPIILKECNVSTVTEATEHCHGNITVYGSHVLYPLLYTEAAIPFNEGQGQDMMKRVKTAHSVHLWNKLTHQKQVQVGSTQGYAMLAEQFCPEVYHNCGEYF